MSSNENIPPEVIRRIVKEIKELTQNALEGVKIMPNEEDITDIQATIDGPADTPYDGGIFKVRLRLGADFPRAPPKAFFLTKIFHPNVSKKGEICVNTLKKDWKEDLGIKHILLTIKCLMIVPNPESSLNEDASRLLLENYDDYFKHAKLWTSIHAPKTGVVDASSASSSSLSSDTPASPAKPTVQDKEKEKVEKKKVEQKKKSLKRL